MSHEQDLHAGRGQRMAVVAARSIGPLAPDDVPALRLFQRAPAGPTVRVYAVGDIGLSGRVSRIGARLGFDSLFADVAPVLQSGDVVFGNLEYPLAGEVAPRGMFAAPPDGARALRDAGFTVLHLANNHVGEHGVAGLAATLSALEAVEIRPLGAGADLDAARRTVRTDHRGVRIGWLGAGRTLEVQQEAGPRYWEFDEQEILAAIREARAGVDVLIVSLHIGLMYLDYPRPEHQSLARAFLEAGADLILMHHAHVLQGVEVTAAGRICCYNLGNFILDSREGNVEVPVMVAEQQQGAIFAFDVDAQGVVQVAALPTRMTSDFCVTWARDERGRAILDRLARLSRALDEDFRAAFERQRAERNTAPILKVLAFHARRGNLRYVVGMLRRARGEHVRMLAAWLWTRLRLDRVARRTPVS